MLRTNVTVTSGSVATCSSWRCDALKEQRGVTRKLPAVVRCPLLSQQVCVEPPSSARNKTLTAFAAERRSLRHGGRSASACIDRRILPKPADRRYCCRSTGQTDGRTDRRTPDRYIDPAQHTMLAASIISVATTTSNVVFQILRTIRSFSHVLCITSL